MQHKDETAIEYMRRIIDNVNYEPECLLETLPSIQAIVEYFELWSVYGTEYWSGGIDECIAEGADPGPAVAFLKKYNLEWKFPRLPGKIPGYRTGGDIAWNP